MEKASKSKPRGKAARAAKVDLRRLASDALKADDVEALAKLEPECRAAGTPLMLMAFDLPEVPGDPDAVAAGSVYLAAMAWRAERSAPWLVELESTLPNEDRFWVEEGFRNSMFDCLSKFGGCPEIRRREDTDGEWEAWHSMPHGVLRRMHKIIGCRSARVASIVAKMSDPHVLAKIERRLLREAAGEGTPRVSKRL